MQSLYRKQGADIGMNNEAAENLGEVVLYKAKNGETTIDVRLAGETVWLSQSAIANLFSVKVPAISKHIKNIYETGELDHEATVSKMETVRTEGNRRVKRFIDFYNLDMIISVGYRINSAMATQFRIWATQTLKKHLIDGYTLNERRLREKGLGEAQQAIQVLARTLDQYELINEKGRDVLDVINRYAKTWNLLQRYDEQQLGLTRKGEPAQVVLDHERARGAIVELKQTLKKKHEASDLFGLEKGNELAGIFGAIEQTFDGHALYVSIEEKAAHLLYFIIKDHPFADGNKRIASFLFVLFLRENRYLYDATGASKINDNALVALALLIAESEPSNKELIINLTMNLLTDRATD